MITLFQKKVLNKIKAIPRGRVTTYKLLATALGNPRGARAVGNALHKNPHPVTVPCHRVVRGDGRIGGYIKGEKIKMKLLEKEGVIITKGKIINFKNILYRF